MIESPAAPPRGLVAVGIATLLVTTGMVIAGAVTTGISSDEPTHVNRLTNFQETGQYAQDRELPAAGTAGATAGDMADHAFAYAPATALLQHAANRLAGNDDGHLSRTSESYVVRHLVIAAIGLAGLCATGAIAGSILRDWRWGVVSAAALAAIPMWTGHSMFNPKDVSVASGHTLVTLGLIALVQRGSWPATASASLAITAGSVLMVGTRPAMWVSLAASLVVFTAGLAWCRTPKARPVTAVALACAASYAALVALYPRVFADPATAFVKTVLVSADFERDQMVSDRSYVFVHTATEWPAILLACLVIGTIVAVPMAWSGLRERSPAAIGVLLVGSQAFALLAIAVLRDSNLYNGLRQLLFSVPAQAVLATIGVAALLAAGRRAPVTTPAVAMLTGVACLGLALPVVAQLAMFPYQYATINTAADLLGAKADTDYWDTSFRALAPQVSDDLKTLCPHFPDQRNWRRSRADCRVKIGGTLNPYWVDRGHPALDDPRGNEYDALARGPLRTPRYCQVTRRVMRWQNFDRITVGKIVRCDPPDTAENKVSDDVNPWDNGWKG